MADATDSVVNNTEASDDAQQEQTTQVNDADTSTEVSATEARIAELEAELTKSREILEKARKGEKYARQTKQQLEQRVAELEAQGDWKAKYEEATTKLNDIAINNSLSAALEAAKALDAKMANKLVDRTAIKVINGVVDAESVETAVLKAKEEFPNQFAQVELPAPRRAAEGAVTGGFEKELAAAKTTDSYKDFLRKNNLI